MQRVFRAPHFRVLEQPHGPQSGIEHAGRLGVEAESKALSDLPQGLAAVCGGAPAPFCVLDEIDAALDESNVGRFSYLLQDFSKIAQFIVITHNKKTIASSDVMYGITMPETGISRIVSVKMAEEEKQKEQVPAGV